MKLGRRSFLKKTGAVAAGVGLAGAASYFYGTRLETEWLDLKRVQIPVRNLRPGLEGFKIALLSDFHLFPHTTLEFIEQAIATANDLKPDLIALTGDYILRTADSIFDLVPALSCLNARHGIVSVLGNHDVWRGRDIIQRELNRAEMRVLDNQGFTLTHGRDSFFIAGVDDAWSGRPDLRAALQDAPDGIPVILLAHEPDPADEYSRDSRVSVQLSGHSHGGQVRFPLVGSPFLPPLGRKYDQGLYKINGMRLYSNVGIGVTVPIRLNCRPEVTEITLVSDA